MLLKILYIVSSAYFFSYYFLGKQVYIVPKFLIPFLWLIIAILINKHRVTKHDKNRLLLLSYPLLLMIILSFACIFLRGFSFSFYTRMISNFLNLMCPLLLAFSGYMIYGKNVIKIFFVSLMSTLTLNLIINVSIYGFKTFGEYLLTALNVTSKNNLTNKLASSLEVGDATIALMFYLFYFVFNKDVKHRMPLILLTSIFLYIGFKRVTIVALVLMLLTYFFLKIKKIDFKLSCGLITFGVAVLSFIQLIFAKYDTFNTIFNFLGINSLGRTEIYTYASNFYSINPFYLGYGLGALNKIMFQQIGFTAHNEIIRLYTELGFLPFFIGVYYYFYFIPTHISKYQSKEVAISYLICTVGLLGLSILGNPLSMLATPTCCFVFMICGERIYCVKKKEKKVNTYEYSNFINARRY